mgnify:CR=1 FL=1
MNEGSGAKRPREEDLAASLVSQLEQEAQEDAYDPLKSHSAVEKAAAAAAEAAQKEAAATTQEEQAAAKKQRTSKDKVLQVSPQ